LAHFAFSAGSKEKVDLFTSQLREAGYKIIGEPRWTGDGFYESAIADPDGNVVEITI
jgi:lactoylglutathione lyase